MLQCERVEKENVTLHVLQTNKWHIRTALTDRDVMVSDVMLTGCLIKKTKTKCM